MGKVEDLPGREMDSRTFFFLFLYFVPSSTRTSFLVCCCWFGEISFLISGMDYIPDMTHVPVKILIKSQFMWNFYNIEIDMQAIYIWGCTCSYTYIMYMINWPFFAVEPLNNKHSQLNHNVEKISRSPPLQAVYHFQHR